MTSFENLEVWKRGCRLTVHLYELLKDCKDLGLKDQMTRAAASIPSDIAEGHERRSFKEYVPFLCIAEGSAAELRTQVYIASRLKMISDDNSPKLVQELKGISSMLQAIISRLKEK